MMRKYVIQTRKMDADGTQTPPVFLEPSIHSALYDISPIRGAIEFLRITPQAEGVWIRVESRGYSITVYEGDRPELDRYSFPLGAKDEAAGDAVLGEETTSE